MSAIENMKAAAVDEVRHGPFMWRVRRVEPADMMKYGLQAVMILEEVADPAGAKKGAAKPRKITDLSDAQRDKVAKANKRGGALVCAGTTHVKEDGGEWEPVTITPTRTADAPGRIYVNDLFPGTANVLFSAIMALSAPLEVAERLRSFRRKPRAAGAPAEDVPDVRQVAS
jgi:hypothetical protein